MAAALISLPETGQLVNVRARRWVVSEVQASTLPARSLESGPAPPQHLVTLLSVEDDALGEELRVVWEMEPGAEIVEHVGLPEPEGFDSPARLDAFLDAVRWGAATSANVGNDRTPFRSGIAIEVDQRDPEKLQRIVETALEVAGQPPLIPADAPGLWPDPKRTASPVFHLPALSPGWARCASGLADPQTGAPRPFVFNRELAKGREDVVLVDLEHRLVQMSLWLLRAEMWPQQERPRRLFRATARVVPDRALKHPALIVHARLVILGGDGQRLHEEIIVAGGEIRDERLVRYTAQRDVQEALDAATDEEPGDEVKQELLGYWRRNMGLLGVALELRNRDRTDSIKQILAKRAAEEAEDVTTRLAELAQTIRDQLTDAQYQQGLASGLGPNEQEQREWTAHAPGRRLTEIPTEIEKETRAIRARYAEPQPRMFPLAVMLLVPRRLAGGGG